MVPIVLGIAGGTGSGKTTVARAIVERIGVDRIAYLEHDAYYRDLAHLPLEARRQVNFDHPDAFDTNLMVQHVRDLCAGCVAVKQSVLGQRTSSGKRIRPPPLSSCCIDVGSMSTST